jgi:hypothetical protein
MSTTPTYLTGEPVMVGDTVRVGHELGVVEIVNVKGSPDFYDWMDEGVMLVGPSFGRMATRFDDEDLFFVSRKKV